VEFRLPDLGEGIHEGEVVDILVSVGDRVIDGQPVMLVETDKATTEIPAPVNGTVEEIRVKPGEVVKVGDVLMVFLEEGGEARQPEAARELRAPEPAPGLSPAVPVPAPAGPGAREAQRESEAAPEGKEGPVPAAPSTRRLARELGVDLHMVTPSGPGGRVTSEDVLAHAETKKAKPAVKEIPPTEREAVPALSAAPFPTAPLPDFGQWGPVERVPLRSVRRATARHMAVAWSQIPHVSHHDTADITELEAFRQRRKGGMVEQGGALSLTVFALKAAVAALKAHPRFNASLDMAAEEIVIKQYYHVGVAVDTDRGLIVPVIRDVDKKSIAELAVEIKSLAERTREGKAERDEMVGGTFTITNIGILGGAGFTPIVNHPEVAILGLGQARWQPVVKGGGANGMIIPRLILPLILGFDHRVVDGADAARFVNLMIELLQDPEKLLLH
jgi:pyruvate dehydrogenase E2 component (dihydrolipoamide acetyltransferase)